MNNEPVAWMHKPSGTVFNEIIACVEPDDLIPLYTHSAKTLTDEIEDLKNELMMEEESYMLLNESFLFAKESIKQQQIKIKELETKTLTDEEILTAIKSIADDVGSYKEYENTYEDGWLDACNTVYDEVFAILRKAQEK